MRLTLLYLFLLTISLSCNQTKKLTEDNIYKLDKSAVDSIDRSMYKYFEIDDSCLGTLEVYYQYWRNDSLGKNGFRDLYRQFILKDCNCKGRNWNIVRK